MLRGKRKHSFSLSKSHSIVGIRWHFLRFFLSALPLIWLLFSSPSRKEQEVDCELQKSSGQPHTLCIDWWALRAKQNCRLTSRVLTQLTLQVLRRVGMQRYCKSGVITVALWSPCSKTLQVPDGWSHFFLRSSSHGAPVLRCTGSSNTAFLFPNLVYPVVSSLPKHFYENRLPDRKRSKQKTLCSRFPVKIFSKCNQICLLQCLILTICLCGDIQPVLKLI